ncbi:hypothetical protein RQP46_007083 [Phenoliferia psychrophenolica]
MQATKHYPSVHLTTFEATFPAYQWAQGFGVVVTPDSTDELTTIQCTRPDCTFSISAVKATFGEIEGWQIEEASYKPGHTHQPPYEPLSLDEENLRRQVPLPLDYKPPFVPLRPFVDLLRSMDERLLQYMATFERLGLADITELELMTIDDVTLKQVIADAHDVPQFAKLEIREALRSARTRHDRGASGMDGSIATPAEKSRVQDWIQRSLATPTAMV